MDTTPFTQTIAKIPCIGYLSQKKNFEFKPQETRTTNQQGKTKERKQLLTASCNTFPSLYQKEVTKVPLDPPWFTNPKDASSNP